MVVVRVRARTNLNPSPDSNPDSSPGPSPHPSSNLTPTLTKCRRRGYCLPRTANLPLPLTLVLPITNPNQGDEATTSRARRGQCGCMPHRARTPARLADRGPRQNPRLADPRQNPRLADDPRQVCYSHV